MAVQAMGLVLADLPRRYGLRPGLSPAMAAAIFFPAAMRLLAEQQDRRLAILRFAAALRVRSSRPGAFDRHKAAMVAGLEHSKGDSQ